MIHSPRRAATDATAARRPAGMVRPVGFWNVGTVYSSLGRSRTTSSSSAPGSTPSPSPGTATTRAPANAKTCSAAR